MLHVTMFLIVVLLLTIVTAITAEEVESDLQLEIPCEIFALLPFLNRYVDLTAYTKAHTLSCDCCYMLTLKRLTLSYSHFHAVKPLDILLRNTKNGRRNHCKLFRTVISQQLQWQWTISIREIQ